MQVKRVRLVWQNGLGQDQRQIIVVEPSLITDAASSVGHCAPYYSEAVKELTDDGDWIELPVSVPVEGLAAGLVRVARLLILAGHYPVPKAVRVDRTLCPVKGAPRIRLPRFRDMRAGILPELPNGV